jgi:hypothetical protein
VSPGKTLQTSAERPTSSIPNRQTPPQWSRSSRCQFLNVCLWPRLAAASGILTGRYRGKHEVYDRLLTGTQVDFQ